MYPNLRAEMARNNIKAASLAELLEISYDSVINKLNGKTDFTRSEIFKIRDNCFPNLKLEYLFDTENKTAKGKDLNDLNNIKDIEF